MKISEIIEKALNEDIGYSDITTDNLALIHNSTTAFLVAKDKGVIAGLEIAFNVFTTLDKNVKCVAYKKDGDWVDNKDEIAKITGRAASLLKAERVALNFLQRMSGIATMTRLLSDKLKGTNCRLLDTRKTTPLLRELEKYAVRIGGGYNHRFGLFDMVLIKENHIRAAGSISEAVKRIKKTDTTHKIEVEVTNFAEVEEALNCRVDRIMLDNMTIEQMKEVIERFSGRAEFEASGNVRLENIAEIAATGIDFISSGAMTHSYKSLDISLLFKEN